MSTKEALKAEIEKLSDKELEELLTIAKQLEKRKRNGGRKDILESLSEIHLEGPDDFSVNHDLYLTGEKTIE